MDTTQPNEAEVMERGAHDQSAVEPLEQPAPHTPTEPLNVSETGELQETPPSPRRPRRHRPQSNQPDRVRANTASWINARIDREMEMRVRGIAVQGIEAINRRLLELDAEWDIERVLQANASVLSLTGIIMSFHNRKWLVLPGLVLPFLFQHAVQGWCPPIPILRRIGIRTRGEIDREKYALIALRGDLDVAHSQSEPLDRANSVLEALRNANAPVPAM